MRVNPSGRAFAQFGRPSDRSERIGKKPHEADLSYTACTALASHKFSNRNEVREGSEGKRGSIETTETPALMWRGLLVAKTTLFKPSVSGTTEQLL
jgi:hypothetical protein